MIEDINLLMNAILEEQMTRKVCEADASPDLRPARGVLVGMILSAVLWWVLGFAASAGITAWALR